MILPALLFLLSASVAAGEEEVLSEAAGCLARCGEQSVRSFAGAYTESDADGGDYDQAPIATKQTRKTCRILKDAEACSDACLFNFAGAGSYSVSTAHKYFETLCDKKKTDWENTFDQCLREKGLDYIKNCTSCGSKGMESYADIAQTIIRALKKVEKSGTKTELTPAFDSSCKLMKCLTPCQADYYKRECGAEAAALTITATRDFMLKIQRQLRLWDSSVWPESCQDIANKEMTLPSEEVRVREMEYFPIDESVWRTNGVGDLLVRLGLAKGNSAPSLPLSPLLLLSTAALVLASF